MKPLLPLALLTLTSVATPLLADTPTPPKEVTLDRGYKTRVHLWKMPSPFPGELHFYKASRLSICMPEVARRASSWVDKIETRSWGSPRYPPRKLRLIAGIGRGQFTPSAFSAYSQNYGVQLYRVLPGFQKLKGQTTSPLEFHSRISGGPSDAIYDIF
jgi:hypothetical protein